MILHCSTNFDDIILLHVHFIHFDQAWGLKSLSWPRKLLVHFNYHFYLNEEQISSTSSVCVQPPLIHRF